MSTTRILRSTKALINFYMIIYIMNRLEKAYVFVHDEKYLSVSRVHLSDTRL